MRFVYPIKCDLQEAKNSKCHLIPRIRFVNYMAWHLITQNEKLSFFLLKRRLSSVLNYSVDVSLKWESLQVLQWNIQFRRNSGGCHRNNL